MHHKSGRRTHCELQTSITLKNRGKQSSPNLICIPGGPGLSSQTLCFRPNFSDINLWMVDPPGTGVAPRVTEYPGNSYEIVRTSIVTAIQHTLRKQRPRGPIYLLGHSFGGIFAIDCADDLEQAGFEISGLILVASPFTKALFRIVEEQRKGGGEQMSRAWNQYRKTPGDRTYNDLKMGYVDMSRGPTRESYHQVKTLLMTEKSCGLATWHVRKRFKADYSSCIARLSWRMTLILGEEDKLLPFKEAHDEAFALGLNVVGIPNAGHFPFVCCPGEFNDHVKSIIQQPSLTPSALPDTGSVRGRSR